jgi:hypothetical protein
MHISQLHRRIENLERLTDVLSEAVEDAREAARQIELVTSQPELPPPVGEEGASALGADSGRIVADRALVERLLDRLGQAIVDESIARQGIALKALREALLG